MQYQQVMAGRFLARPNRFIALVETEAGTLTCHVKNTGRCRELLVPGATVYLEHSGNPARKTAYDLIAVEKGTRLINMDAQAPNRVFREWAAAGKFLADVRAITPEATWGQSRLDFRLEDSQGNYWVEVKGVTLEKDGRCYFPDAPTERGVKHLHELIHLVQEGQRAAVFFVIQMADVESFSPNDETHPAFGQALREARQAGVGIFAHCCRVAPDTLELAGPVPVLL
jgi:sugar fermentation stimulation protein A